MGELITFPDAVDTAIKVVNDAPAVPVPAHGRVPDQRPAAFIRIRRVGGPKQNLVMDGAQLAVESWAATDTAAHDNLQTARAALYAASGDVVGGVTIGLVEELSGPGDLPDPDSDQPRVTMTMIFPCRGA